MKKYNYYRVLNRKIVFCFIMVFTLLFNTVVYAVDSKFISQLRPPNVKNSYVSHNLIERFNERKRYKSILYLSRIEGEERLQEVFSLNKGGYLALGDMDLLGRINKLYGRIADFLNEQTLMLLHSYALRYGGFTVRWSAGDESIIYLPPQIDFLKAKLFFEQMNKKVRAHFKRKYGIARIHKDKVTISDIKKMRNHRNIFVVDKVGKNHIILFDVIERNLSDSLKMINKNIDLKLELDKYNNGWLFYPTISIGYVNLSKYNQQKTDSTFDKFLEEIRMYLNRALQKAKEKRNMVVYDSMEKCIEKEESILVNKNIEKELPRFSTLPLEEKNNKITDFSLNKKENLRLIRLIPSYRGGMLNDMDDKEQLFLARGIEGGWSRFKAINHRYGFLNGDKTISLVYNEVVRGIKNFISNACFLRGSPDEIIIEIGNDIEELKLLDKINEIEKEINSKLKVEIGFDVMQIILKEGSSINMRCELEMLKKILTPDNNIIKPIIKGNTRLFTYDYNKRDEMIWFVENIQENEREVVFEALTKEVMKKYQKLRLLTEYKNSI